MMSNDHQLMRLDKVPTDNENNIKTPINPIEIKRFLLNIYRKTRLNWNITAFTSPLSTGIAFLLSKYKLNYTNINELNERELDIKLAARNPQLTSPPFALAATPLWNFTQSGQFSTAVRDIIDQLKQLSCEEIAQLEIYARDGNDPTAQLWMSFLCFKSNPKLAKEYLEKSAQKNDLAKFFLLRNKLFSCPSWGITQNLSKALLTQIEQFISTSNLYKKLCASMLFEAYKSEVIDYGVLSPALRKLIDPLIWDDLNPEPVAAYSRPG